jgi:hypothetical protein
MALHFVTIDEGQSASRQNDQTGSWSKLAASCQEDEMTRARSTSTVIAATAIALTASVSSLATAQTQDAPRTNSKSESILTAYGDLNGDRQRSYCIGSPGDQNAAHQGSYVGMNEPQPQAATSSDAGGKSAARAAKKH